MIAAITTAKTKTSFQEIFFNDLFPFKVVFNPPEADAHYHHTKAPENLLNDALICPAAAIRLAGPGASASPAQ
jgi:hypothetical protein